MKKYELVHLREKSIMLLYLVQYIPMRTEIKMNSCEIRFPASSETQRVGITKNQRGH